MVTKSKRVRAVATSEDLRKMVNTSGFPFQLGVEREVKETRLRHGWEVLPREHPWRQAESGKSGYIDLILSKGFARMVVECKRPRDGTWVFLVPDVPTNGSLMRFMQIRT